MIRWPFYKPLARQHDNAIGLSPLKITDGMLFIIQLLGQPGQKNNVKIKLDDEVNQQESFLEEQS